MFSLKIMPAYIWRLAFASGAFLSLIVVIIYTIYGLLNSEIAQDKKYHRYKNISVYKIICENFYIFILGMLLAGSVDSSRQFITVFFLTYISKMLKYIDADTMRYLNIIGSVIEVVCCIIGGYFVAVASAMGLLLINISVYFTGCAIFSCLYASGLLTFTESIPSVIKLEKVQNFGKNLIIVSDDGIGMSRTDLSLSIERLLLN